MCGLIKSTACGYAHLAYIVRQNVLSKLLIKCLYFAYNGIAKTLGKMPHLPTHKKMSLKQITQLQLQIGNYGKKLFVKKHREFDIVP